MCLIATQTVIARGDKAQTVIATNKAQTVIARGDKAQTAIATNKAQTVIARGDKAQTVNRRTPRNPQDDVQLG